MIPTEGVAVFETKGFSRTFFSGENEKVTRTVMLLIKMETLSFVRSNHRTR